jgi:hypothetical protein
MAWAEAVGLVEDVASAYFSAKHWVSLLASE